MQFGVSGHLFPRPLVQPHEMADHCPSIMLIGEPASAETRVVDVPSPVSEGTHGNVGEFRAERVGLRVMRILEIPAHHALR